MIGPMTLTVAFLGVPLLLAAMLYSSDFTSGASGCVAVMASAASR